MERAATVCSIGPRLFFGAPVGQQKTVDPIRPTALVSVRRSFRRGFYLVQGTDLPSSSLPVGASRCAMKAQMRKCIAVSSLLCAGG